MRRSAANGPGPGDAPYPWIRRRSDRSYSGCASIPRLAPDSGDVRVVGVPTSRGAPPFVERPAPRCSRAQAVPSTANKTNATPIARRVPFIALSSCRAAFAPPVDSTWRTSNSIDSASADGTGRSGATFPRPAASRQCVTPWNQAPGAGRRRGRAPRRGRPAPGPEGGCAGVMPVGSLPTCPKRGVYLSWSGRFERPCGGGLAPPADMRMSSISERPRSACSYSCTRDRSDALRGGVDSGRRGRWPPRAGSVGEPMARSGISRGRRSGPWPHWSNDGVCASLGAGGRGKSPRGMLCPDSAGPRPIDGGGVSGLACRSLGPLARLARRVALAGFGAMLPRPSAL